MADKSKGNLSKYILKYSNNKDKNLKYDFMPSLLEIIERPAHVAGKVIVVAIACLLLVAIVWAYFAKIDIVVSGNGSIVTEADTGIVTSQVSGVVDEFYVSEGDYVKNGDILLELNTSEVDLEIMKIEDEIDLLEVKREVITKFAEDINAQVSAGDYDEKYKYVINDIIYENELYKLQTEQSMLKSEILEKQYESGLNEELLQIDEKMRAYEDELKKQKLLLDKMIIKAPTEGYVLSSSIGYKGQNVTNYEELFVIIPNESKYVFEGYVFDKDIADISVGDTVQIKLQSYSFSDYGAVTGTVSYISPSAIKMEGVGNVYIVRTQIDEKLLGSDIRLMSGLSGNMEINVGRRSVLDYFLEPIIGGLDDSLKEK